MMLSLDGITTVYGKNQMLQQVSLRVKKGDCVCLLGPNGAGKTTLIKAILALAEVVEGTIHFLGRRIDRLKTHQIINRGISIIPEGKRIFSKMTVVENLRMGAFKENDRRTIRSRMDYIFSLFPRLKERSKQIAGTLSGGEQSMLGIGRGLMASPKLMIFDEPSLGLAPVLVEEIFHIIRQINESGVTCFMVEQNAHKTLSVAKYGYLLQAGKILEEGTSQELRESRIIREAYFA
ncbi:MAG: ABC transporter ATP-binding protein [PVC group bacterium]